MKPFTVIYTHNLPFGGVVSHHYSWVFQENAVLAADYCLKGIGGYGSIIVVMEGHATPVLKGSRVHVWDDSIQYKTKELDIIEWTKPVKQNGL